MTYPWLVALVMCLHVMTQAAGEKMKFPYNQEENDPEFWNKMAAETLKDAAKVKPIYKKAKNVILMLGDGYSMTTITASRILKGQKLGKSGEESVLAFEKMPNLGLSKTYNVDHQIPDSAGTGTAYLHGVKSTYATIGVNGRVKRADCAASLENRGKSILAYAQDAGKATGIARVTHASPANTYASVPERRWENDSKMKAADKAMGCQDIGAQLVGETGKNFKVVLGGGRRELTPNTTKDVEYPEKMGRRTDGRNISSVNGHLKYKLDNTDNNDPSLAEMSEKAIKILQRDGDGFVLFIEGALIDVAHHDNYATQALHEALEFDKAVERVQSLVKDDDTLVIVTADHSHSLIMNSYSTRGNYILGLSDHTDDDQPGGPDGNSDIDMMPYTTLIYGNGPGYTSPRENITNDITDAPYYKIQAGVPNLWVSHDGTDVPIYASGPMGHMIHTTHEQNYIFHVMKYAACLGEHKDAEHCDGDGSTCGVGGVRAGVVLVVVVVAMAVFG